MLVHIAVVTENDKALSIVDTETQLYLDFLYLTIRQYHEGRHTVDPLTECFDDLYKKTNYALFFGEFIKFHLKG